MIFTTKKRHVLNLYKILVQNLQELESEEKQWVCAGMSVEFSHCIRSGLLTMVIYFNPFSFWQGWNPLHLQNFTER